MKLMGKKLKDMHGCLDHGGVVRCSPPPRPSGHPAPSLEPRAQRFGLLKL